MMTQQPFTATARADPDDLRREIGGELVAVRRRLGAMTDRLDEATMHRQHDPIMSPLVWDIGHVGNFEEVWALREVAGHGPHDTALDQVYNPFDNPRRVRADLPILPEPEADRYLADVRAEAIEILRTAQLQPDPDRALLAEGYVFRMLVQHEAQHQETMLQTLDLSGFAPPHPAVAAGEAGIGEAPAATVIRPARARRVDDTERQRVPGGPFRMGTDDRTAAYDNERPSHTVRVPTFDIDRYPVTTRRWAEFVDDEGYEREDNWDEAGRAWLTETGHRGPQGWIPDTEGGWLVRRFGHVAALDPREPVQHVCAHEARAFANWAGGRLPTEAEWEKAAANDPETGASRTYPWGETPPMPAHANLDLVGWGPAPVGAHPAGASAYGVEQMLGDVYEWTASTFRGYPDYRTFPYPEYSEVFFGDDHVVLRGASWATSRWVARSTFRNWDYPQRRQLFAGLRLVWDVIT